MESKNSTRLTTDLNLKIAYDFLPRDSMSNHLYYQLHSYGFLWKYWKAETSKDIGKIGNFSSSQCIIHFLQNSMWTLKNPKAFRGRASNKDGKWPWNESMHALPETERHSRFFVFLQDRYFSHLHMRRQNIHRHISPGVTTLKALYQGHSLKHHF